MERNYVLFVVRVLFPGNVYSGTQSHIFASYPMTPRDAELTCTLLAQHIDLIAFKSRLLSQEQSFKRGQAC